MDLKEKHREVVRAYKTVFQSPAGRLVLQDLATRCRVMSLMYNPAFTGDTTTDLLFREGRRSVYLDIVGMIDIQLDKDVQNTQV